MSSKQAKLICGLFAGFIGLLGLLNLLWPVKEFSEMENRMLAQYPKFSFQSLFAGKWTVDFEKYLTDQFPLRDTWVGGKYVAERVMLRQENNGVYFAQGGRLIARFDAPDEKRVETNFAAIDALAKNTGLPTRFLLVPTAAYIYQDSLPKGAPSYDQQILLDRAKQLEHAQTVPVEDELLANRESYLYYRTDHHWTTTGAQLAYQAYMQAIGRGEETMSQGALAHMAREVTGFLGTLQSQAGARFYAPDTITWYDFPNLTMQEPQGEEKSIYDLSYGEKKDKYALFFGGNPPLFTIHNSDPAAQGTLLVIKDSFANSLLPFVANHYKTVQVFDPRYNRTPISEYAAQCGADEILVLYQTANFATDVNVGLLAR